MVLRAQSYVVDRELQIADASRPFQARHHLEHRDGPRGQPRAASLGPSVNERRSIAGSRLLSSPMTCWSLPCASTPAFDVEPAHAGPHRWPPGRALPRRIPRHGDPDPDGHAVTRCPAASTALAARSACSSLAGRVVRPTCWPREPCWRQPPAWPASCRSTRGPGRFRPTPDRGAATPPYPDAQRRALLPAEHLPAETSRCPGNEYPMTG